MPLLNLAYPNYPFKISNNAPYLFLVAQTIKNLPAMREMRVQSLGWEEPLEKGMATHSSVLAWRIPRPEEPGEIVHGVAKSQT